MTPNDNATTVPTPIDTPAMFAFLPLIAFLNMLLYRRPRRRYAEQLVFFLHLQAFFFSAGIVIVLLGWSLPIYTVLALRQVFKNRWPATLLKAFALSVGYFILALVTSLVAVVYAALEL